MLYFFPREFAIVPCNKIYLWILIKILFNKLFALVLFGIIQDSLGYIESKNEQGENRFHKEKQK